MTVDPFEGAPKPGAFVQAHLRQIFDHIAEVDPDEFLRLQMKDYSLEQFRISYPFFKNIDQIVADGQSAQYYATSYEIQGQQVRVCNYWLSKHRPFFLAYLVARRIPVIGVSPEMHEEWLAIAEQAGTTATSLGGARYKGKPIGDAQNAFVRYLLSNIGQESFTQQDWETVKDSLGNSCVYCGHTGVLHMDHAIPLSRLQLGEHRLGNLVPACPACNGKKSHLRFRPFLEARYDHDPNQAARRVATIETHAERHGYRPLENRDDVRELLERARQEIADTASRYVMLINELVQHGVTEKRRC